MPLELGICTYCGVTATCMDHVRPYSLDHIRRRGKRRESAEQRRKRTIPACTECNVLLSNEVLLTIELRADYLHHRLKKRYVKLLQSPDWDEEELKELECGMAASVRSAQVARHIVEERIAHTRLVSGLKLSQNEKSHLLRRSLATVLSTT